MRSPGASIMIRTSLLLAVFVWLSLMTQAPQDKAEAASNGCGILAILLRRNVPPRHWSFGLRPSDPSLVATRRKELPLSGISTRARHPRPRAIRLGDKEPALCLPS